MQIASTEIKRIATLLGADYMRTMALSDANQNVHYKAIGNPLIIYNGSSPVATLYEGAEIIDRITCEIWFLVMSTDNDMTGDEADALLQEVKLLANGFYQNLYTDASTIVRFPDSYVLTPQEILFDDRMIGLQMDIVLSFDNEGCSPPPTP